MDRRVVVIAGRGVAIAAVALLAAACKPGMSTNDAAPTSVASPPKAVAEAAKTAVDSAVAPIKGIVAGAGLSAAAATKDGRTPSLDFSVPRTVAVGKSDDVSFVIQSATVEQRNPDSVRVVLLMRMSNRSRYQKNFWDATFRLVAHDSIIPASGGLNAVVDGNSDSMLERVLFIVPMSSAPRALRIERDDEVVELPLRFT